MGQVGRKLLAGQLGLAWPGFPREPGQDQLTQAGERQAPEWAGSTGLEKLSGSLG